MLIILLILSLLIILLSCELFTNGIEWLGKKLKLGDAVVGSILSAIGTCLPETIIPIIAILCAYQNYDSKDIAVGAIVGAPFMLGTLAFFVVGMSVILFEKVRKSNFKMNIDRKILQRDMIFFIITYTLSITASFIADDNHILKYGMAILLIIIYVFYVLLTLKNDNVTQEKIELLYMTSFLNVRPTLTNIILQITISLLGIFIGANLFVKNIEILSRMLGISTLIVSFILAPVATELPEKFNSIVWIRKRKDSLALGNITGAMVFQSCIPMAIGIVFTSWNLDSITILSAFLTLTEALFIYFWVKGRKTLTFLPLTIGGVFYAIFIVFVLGILA